MAKTYTYYLPNEDGWSPARPSSGTWKQNMRFRFKVVQTYDTSTTATTIVVHLQARDPSANNVWTVSANDTIKIAGTSYNIAGYTFNTGSSNAWVDIRSSGSAKTWTINSYSLSNSSLALACDFEVSYSGYGCSCDNSGSVSLNQFATYILSTSEGTGSAVAVTRTASYKSGASIGALASGATLYHGDTLQISFGADIGYSLTTHTVNGSTFASGGTHAVSANVTVVSEAVRLSYTLAYSADANSSVAVMRSGSALANGATIYYGDVLTITATPNAGYEIASSTINGTAFTSPKSMNVTGNVTIAVTSSALGFAYIRRSGTETPYLIYIRRSGAWTRYRSYVRRSGAWTAY